MRRFRREVYILAFLCAILLSLAAFAGAEEYSGTCGDNLTWRLEDGVLTISGEGEMREYHYYSDPNPWSAFDVKSVVIEHGVTNIGKYAFYNCGSLTDVTIPDSVTRIDYGAFTWCKSLF